VLYYGDPQRVFVLLHAFEKRTAQIPLQETSIAKQRMVIDLGKKKGRL
jgi:phage-related protein